MTSDPTTGASVVVIAGAVTGLTASTVLAEPRRHGLPVRGEVFGGGEGDDPVGHLAQRVFGVLDEVHAAQERLHGQPRRVPGAAAGGQHVVRARAVVAERHRRPRPDEHRPRVADLQRDLAGPRGLDLQVLGGVGVDDREAGRDVRDEDRARLRAGERGADALGVLGGRDLPLELGVDRVRERVAGGDQHGRGRRVVLGLGDQVRGDVHRVRRLVGEHRDLGGPGLAVDPDLARAGAAWPP